MGLYRFHHCPCPPLTHPFVKYTTKLPTLPQMVFSIRKIHLRTQRRYFQRTYWSYQTSNCRNAQNDRIHTKNFLFCSRSCGASSSTSQKWRRFRTGKNHATPRKQKKGSPCMTAQYNNLFKIFTDGKTFSTRCLKHQQSLSSRRPFEKGQKPRTLINSLHEYWRTCNQQEKILRI